MALAVKVCKSGVEIFSADDAIKLVDRAYHSIDEACSVIDEHFANDGSIPKRFKQYAYHAAIIGLEQLVIFASKYQQCAEYLAWLENSGPCSKPILDNDTFRRRYENCAETIKTCFRIFSIAAERISKTMSAMVQESNPDYVDQLREQCEAACRMLKQEAIR